MLTIALISQKGGVGKTTLAIHLATAYAALSKRTLLVDTARGNGADVVILDTAPHSEGTALEAARAADLILVPCQPSIMDLRAMRKTADILNYLKKPTFAVLNEVAPQGTVADEAAKAITAQFGMPVCPVRLGQRVAFNRCLLGGQTAQEYEPGGKAAQEIEPLRQWVSEAVGLLSSLPVDKRTKARTGKVPGKAIAA